MPCPHNEITIVQRSQRQSAVAAAAYQSGEKLFCEYDQQVKHYPEKRGIVHNEILLPANLSRALQAVSLREFPGSSLMGNGAGADMRTSPPVTLSFSIGTLMVLLTMWVSSLVQMAAGFTR